MSDVANILFGPKAPRVLPVSGKKQSQYPPPAAYNISKPLFTERSVASSPPRTSSLTARTAGGRLIPAIGASPSTRYPSNGSRASTLPKSSLLAEPFAGGQFETSLPLSNPSGLQPSSLGYSWSQPKTVAYKGASWARPTIGDSETRSTSLPTLTPRSSIGSLTSVKYLPGTAYETPAQLNMTLTAQSEKRPRVTASVSTIASSASLLPYLNSPRLDGRLGTVERRSLEAVKMIPPSMEPSTASIPPVPPLPSGFRPSLPTVTSNTSKGSKTTLSSFTSTLRVAGTSITTIDTTRYVPTTRMVPASPDHPPSLHVHVRNSSPASVDHPHNPKQISLDLTSKSTSSSPSPSPTQTESSSSAASSAATSSSSFTRKYTHLPSLSAIEIAGMWVGDVERKGMQRSPTRTSNIASTVTTFEFPLPPTHIPRIPAEVVQETRQAAQLPRQRPHELITKPSTSTPATYVSIDLIDPEISLFAARPPPPPSTGHSQNLRKWQQPPATSTTAPRRLQRPKGPTCAATPYESFLPSFDDMEAQSSNTIPRLPGANGTRSRTALSRMHPSPTFVAT